MLGSPRLTQRREVGIEAEAAPVGVQRRHGAQSRGVAGFQLGCRQPRALGVGRQGVDDAIELTRGGQLADLAQAQQGAVGVLALHPHGFHQRQVAVLLVAPAPNGCLYEHSRILRHHSSLAVDVSPLHYPGIPGPVETKHAGQERAGPPQGR